jgi:hypothetical protein
MLLLVHRRAAASLMLVGSARSNSSAFGMKSKADPMRMSAWLAKPVSSQLRTSGWDQATITDITRVTSNMTCAGIQIDVLIFRHDWAG